MEVPVWKVLTSTNAPVLRTGVALTASTKPRQVSTTQLLSETQEWNILLYMFTTCSVSGQIVAQVFNFDIISLIQHHLSGVLWMIQRSVGDLAVPKWTKPNTAAVMQASTWVALLTTVSVRVSCNCVLLNLSLWGNSPFPVAPHREASSAAEQFPRAGGSAQRYLNRANSRCYKDFGKDSWISEYFTRFNDYYGYKLE